MEEGGKLAASISGASTAPWRGLLAAAVRDVDELWRLLALPADCLPAARRVAAGFPLLVPRGFLALMRPGDLADPLLRQVVPLGDEERMTPGFTSDPLAESSCSPVPGLLHKYHGRALLVTTGACAVHCRYCFRRHFPYESLPRSTAWWSEALAYVRADASIEELILSGGDPLTLPDRQLAELAAQAAAIPHLRRLRIHSRLPVVLPERIDETFLAWFTTSRLKPVMVIHANHSQELSPAVAQACGRLRQAGVMLLNQSVLLAGVNDDAAVLADLSRRLVDCGVQPYYLHVLDHVQGAGHFLVDDERARALARAVAEALPGWMVPRLVREEAGAPGKSPLF